MSDTMGPEKELSRSPERPMEGGELLRQLRLDLHDGPMQLLYAALLQLELLHASLGGDPEPAHRVMQLKALVERASTELRAVIDRDRTVREESPDLLSLLREVGTQHQFATRTRVRFLAREHLPDPGPEGKHALYRVLQESLSNAYRHGGAEEVAVSLGFTDQDGERRLWMSVQDDGCGFDPDELAADRESGLIGMTQRMRSAGGDLAVRSSPGNGTTVRAALEVG
jgi:signal transduction histidine kinase